MHTLRAVIVVAALCGLTACQERITAADIKGACDAFDAPGEPIYGKTRVDQRWIDKAIEAGVSACGWSRPKAKKIVNKNLTS